MSIEKFIQDGQDPKIVEKIYSKIEDMLSNGEEATYMAVQKKPAMTLLPDCIMISNRRIFLCEFTKLGLSTNFEIFHWREIKDIAFKEEIFGSKVTVIPFTGENISIDYIPKTQARKLYQYIKDALEESKLESTPPQNIPIANTPIAPIATSSVEQSSHSNKEEEIIASEQEAESNKLNSPEPMMLESDELTKKLQKLKSLFDKQLITQSEYEKKKAEILEQL